MSQSNPLILVVDDDPQVRQFIRWTLEGEGFAVETAADGRQALERFKAQRPALLVLDVTLPLLDGFGVAEAVRTDDEPVPILTITADGSAAAKAQQIGAYAYLKKPFELEALLEAVHLGLNGSALRQA